MLEKHEWDQRYAQNELPWDTGRPTCCLMQLFSSWPVFTGKILEVGCGTGANSVWMAKQGHQVTGMDISAKAVAAAQQRAEEQGASCTFVEANFLTSELEPEQFALLFDRGCFHVMNEEQRSQFARQAASCLERGGLWFSLMGNSDQPSEGQGPPRLSAAQICASVEPFFEILSLESFLLDSKKPEPPRFWKCLMRVRK
jgi:2-polyprenyl-3-methyl-5-hydroxy-6-metoxy-1,4-benzoquinol methylase